MNMEVTMPGEPVREFLDVWAGSVGIKGTDISVSPMVDPSMAPFGGLTALPGMHTTAMGLAIAINFAWREMVGRNAPVITEQAAAEYLPGNLKGPSLPK